MTRPSFFEGVAVALAAGLAGSVAHAALLFPAERAPGPISEGVAGASGKPGAARAAGKQECPLYPVYPGQWAVAIPWPRSASTSRRRTSRSRSRRRGSKRA